MIDLSGAPFPITYRELWLPRAIKDNAILSRSRYNGHDLALTGAQKGSTVNGLEMRGAERITIVDHGDIHIADLLTVVLPTFILSGTFPDDYAANMGLMNLNNGAVIARLNQGTGALDFIFNNVDGGADVTVSTTKVSWAANTLWQVSFTFVNSGTGVISIRLYINGVADATNDQVDGPIVVPAGNTVLGEDLTTFFTDKFQGMFLVYDTAILTAARLLDAYRGIPYDVNLKAYIPLDHPGRGLAMPDRSTGGNCSGTISGANIGAEIWDFGQCKHPVISFDGINDLGQSSAGVDVSGATTTIWAGKLKAHYDGVLEDRYFVEHFIDNTNHYTLYLNCLTGDIRWLCTVGGASVVADLSGFGIEIGDYAILIGTVSAGGVTQIFANGILHDVGTGLAPIAAGGITTYIGAEDSPAYYDVSKPLLVALIDGAFTQEQAKVYSRWLDRIFHLGLGI